MISFEDFKKMDLRIARIVEVNDHPNADRLYVIKIRVDDTEKQIVAGIKQFYTPAELVGRDVVVVNNLEPAKLRGEDSNGMILAAKRSDGMPVILVPERDVEPGSQIG